MRNPYIIAEVASTHEGDFDYLCKLIQKIGETGADAVKFQIYLADEIYEKDHPDYQDLLSYQLTEEQWSAAIHQAREVKLDVWVDLSGPYGQTIINLNMELIKGVKLHSSDTNNIFVIDFIKQSDLDVIISCGGTTLVELFGLLDQIGAQREIILMHGFQSYPTDIRDCHIQRVKSLNEVFPYRIGFADHISGDSPIAKWIPLVALGAGATVFEKHITLNRSEKRDDYYSSLEPAEFSEMVGCLRQGAESYGDKEYDFSKNEIAYRKKMKKIAVSKRPIEKGYTIAKEDIDLLVPSTPEIIPSVETILSHPLKHSIKINHSIKHSDIESKVVIFVNARSASSRLPRKALIPFYDQFTTIEYLLMRLKGFPDLSGKIVFATTTEKEDDALVTCAEKVGVDYVRGANRDVMKRMLQVGEYGNFDTLVRVTGDSILLACEYINYLLDFHFENCLEYSRINGLPIGMDCEVIDLNALSLVHKAVVDKSMTEQLMWYIDANGICKNGMMKVKPEHRLDEFRLTLDYQEDFDLMKMIVADLHPKNEGFYIPTEAILNWLREKQPAWRDKPSLWPLKRESVNTSLRYTV